MHYVQITKSDRWSGQSKELKIFLTKEDAMAFFTDFRNFLNTTKNYLIIFASCLGASMFSMIGAIIIDKEFVRSIEWL